MSKENNLKDYLTDLYEGIVSKKPGASRNPQNFRAEIESIEAGGNGVELPEWDGYVTTSDSSGNPIPTEGLAYVLASDGKSYYCKGIGTATEKDIIIATTYNGLPVTKCDDGAFYSNKTITGVTLGSNMTQVGYQAFTFCANLRRVIIPSSVTVISNRAFKGCSSLASVTLPNGVTTIQTYAFADCSYLSKITIPNTVTSIGLYAFEDCNILADVYYSGTESEWNNRLSIDTGNSCLKNATIHYNS